MEETLTKPKSPILIIFGPIASGKGTQAQMLTESLGIIHISLGDVLREQAQLDTPQAKIIKEYMDKGDLVPYEIVDELVRKRLDQPDVKNGLIFDGYPRALEQAKTLVDMLEKRGKKITKVISLQLGPDEILKRLSTRLICTKCRSIYNTISDPPKMQGICDKCGSPLKKRADDQEIKAIHERMQIYKEETIPVLEYFAHMGLVEEFDASLSIEALHDLIFEALIEQ